MSGAHALLCVGGPPNHPDAMPHWCCKSCTVPAPGGRRQCTAHRLAPPCTPADGLWAATLGAPRPLAAFAGPRSGSTGHPEVRATRCGRGLELTVAARVSAAVPDAVTVYSVRLQGPCRMQARRWALVPPWSTVSGAVVPLYPLLPGGVKPVGPMEVRALSWKCATAEPGHALPGVPSALLQACMASPCAAERWWFCGRLPPRGAVVRHSRVERACNLVSAVAPFVVEGCPLPICAVPPSGAVQHLTGGVVCGRCGTAYCTEAAYRRACAPDAALPLAPSINQAAAP